LALLNFVLGLRYVAVFGKESLKLKGNSRPNFAIFTSFA